MASMMENRGLIIANDVNGARMKPLGLNVQRSGVEQRGPDHDEGPEFFLEEDRV